MSKVDKDPYLWLEEVESEKAIEWAKSLNQLSKDELTAESGFEILEKRLLAALDSKKRIPGVTIISGATMPIQKAFGDVPPWRNT